MNKREKLEFNKIIDEIKQFSLFDSTKEKLNNIEESTDLDEINTNLFEEEELRKLIVSYKDIPFNEISDIMDIIKKTDRLQIITIKDGLRIIKFINGLKSIENFFNEYDVDYLKKYNSFKDLDTLKNSLEKVISPYELIYDNASEKLFHIRSDIKTLNNKIRDILQTTIQKNQKYLQDTLITSKSNTLCLSVKEEYKNVIKGTIIDESNTGSTVYIEPVEILSIKAILQTKLNEEVQEIERILYSLTEKINKYNLELEYNLTIVRRLDYIQSIAKYAIKIDARKPIITNDQTFKLIKARHPLINKEKVVPLDLEITNNCIIITGPNTGGKTVVLKTVGLLSLMTKCSLLIPVFEGTIINIFDEIFIDLGDEQSIEQNLSTFSSHMKNVISLTNNISSNSLVLLDELGGGTDPDEGVSLAIAILNYIRKFKSTIITTTHYQRLKLYAYETNALNAKMEFDENTLSPTYNLLVGTPGKSCGILVAKHLGLKQSIIDDAITSLDVEDDFKILDNKNDELDKLIKDNKKIKEDYDELKKEYEEKINKLNQEKNDIIIKAKKEANDIIAKTKENANTLIKELEEAKKNNDTPIVAKLKNQAKNFNELDDFVRSDKKIEINSVVYIIPYKSEGVVIDIKNKNYIVKIGSISMTFKEEDLSYIKENKKKEETKKKSYMTKQIKKSAKIELDLRGMRYEDARYELDKFVDDALLMNYKSISIIHGFGTGVIRKMVWEYLKNCPNVKSYRYGGENEGLQGATIVELK